MDYKSFDKIRNKDICIHKDIKYVKSFRVIMSG